ncbi:MAG: hypothetical protein ACREDF_04070 [Thermoplasmata archaeon]
MKKKRCVHRWTEWVRNWFNWRGFKCIQIEARFCKDCHKAEAHCL